MKKGKIRRLLSITLLGTMLASSVVQAAPLSDTAENENLEYLAYYPLTEDVQDHSGNETAQNAELKGTGAAFKDGALYLPGGAANSSCRRCGTSTGNVRRTEHTDHLRMVKE